MKFTLRFLALAASVSLSGVSWADSLVFAPARPLAPAAGAAADSHNPGVSADGRFVVFVSAADNLVTNDSNGELDVFVRDRQLGHTILVSVDLAAVQSGNKASHSPTLSANGQFVVFESLASNLVTNDNNKSADVFVRDLATGSTTLVSVNAWLASANVASTTPTLTPDGRYALFASRALNMTPTSDNNNAADLFVRDLVLRTTRLVTRSYNNISSFAGTSPVWDGGVQISDNGQWIAFHSAVNNLLASDPNGKSDVFIRDPQVSSNIVLSVHPAGTVLGNGHSQSASMDATGRYVAFQSAASNLSPYDTNVNSDIFRRNVMARTTRLASVNTNGISSSSGNSFSPVLSKQGNAVVFLSTANDLVAGDTNTAGADLFRRDFDADTTVLVGSKVAPGGDTSVPALSADGRFVLYQDAAQNLVLFDAVTNARKVISTNTPAADGVMSADGNFIVFVGPSELTGVRNVYLHDRSAGSTELVSVREPALTMTTGSAASRVIPGGVSFNGQFAVFESYAADLSPGDTNRTRDVWSIDLNGGSNSLVRPNSILQGFSRGPSRRPVISGDSRWIAFEAIPDSTPVASLETRYNLYAFDRLAQTNVLVGGVGKVVAPSLAAFSQSGNFLVFRSSESGVGGYTTTASQIYYRDLAETTNRVVSLNSQGTAPGAGHSIDPSISPDGRYVTYVSAAPDLVTNPIGGPNAFLWDATTGSNILISISDAGSGLNQVSKVAFEANGGLVSFQRGSTNYLFDVATQSIVDALADAINISVSADGSLVACERSDSYSPADTNGVADVYAIDRATGVASLVSVSADGRGSGDKTSLSTGITPDGRYVLFRSRASNLVANDINGVGDVFIRDLVLNRTILLSLNRDGGHSGNRLSGNPIISADGITVLFESHASDLVSGDYNEAGDLVVLRLSHGDSDGDGLPDDWELAYFNGLAADGTADRDGDDQDDRTEFRAGTDPTNAGSALRVITLATPAGGPVRVFWSAVPEKKYRIQFKDSLWDAAWTDLPGEVVATDLTGFKDDTTPGATGQRYYRVLLVL